MTYSYRCRSGHAFEEQFPIGQAPATVFCPNAHANVLDGSCVADRDYGADFAGVTFGIVDPYRTFHLGSKATKAEGEQQRMLDAPRDNFERKRLERDLGRKYIGDEVSLLRPEAQRGIRMYQEKKNAGERV